MRALTEVDKPRAVSVKINVLVAVFINSEKVVLFKDGESAVFDVEREFVTVIVFCEIINENFVVLVVDISVFERGYIVLAKAYYRFIFND